MKSCAIVSVVHKPNWFNRTNHVLPMGIHNFYKHDALEFYHKFLKLES